MIQGYALNKKLFKFIFWVIGRGFGGMARRFSKEDSRAIIEHCSTKTRNSPRWANKILNPVPENPAFSGLQEISNSF